MSKSEQKRMDALGWVAKYTHDAALARIVELEADVAKWHAAYMELKYPNGPPPFPGATLDRTGEPT